VKALRIRRLVFEAGALFAGRMPMTSCFVGGGVTNDGTENLTPRINSFRTIMTEVGLFIIQEYVPIALALGALYPAFDSQTNSLGAHRGSGAGLGRFLAWGAFPNLDNTLTSKGGVFDTNTAAPSGFPANEDVTHFRVGSKADVYAKFLTGGTFSVPANLTEDITNSRYSISSLDTSVYTGNAAYPGAVSRTKPNRANGYTYIKAPRWNGLACEVGPLARLVVAGIYPTNGSTLTSIPGYKEIYTVNGDGTGGLDARVVEGTIAQGLVADGLITSVVANGATGVVPSFILGLTGGLSTLDRLRARAIESLVLIQAVLGAASKNVTTGALAFAGGGWVDQLANLTGTSAKDVVGSTWAPKRAQSSLGVVQGWGGNEAARGALMHQATVNNGRITKYQCIVPTTWNGSPRAGDITSEHGAIEAAMIGAKFFLSTGTDTGNPLSTNGKGGATFTKQGGASITTEGGVEVLRIAQSFDPCIACAIH
jgi:hydrogenase large subunit